MRTCREFKFLYALALCGSLFPLVSYAGPDRSGHKVLVIHSFGSTAPPFTTHSIAFGTELTERSGERIDLDEVWLNYARYSDTDMEKALVEYLEKRQAKWQPDLVVPIGSPAGVFAAQYQDRLFPQTPILYCGLDRRRLPAESLNKNAAFIGENFNVSGFVEDMLQVAPATTNIAVVIGASALEQYWAAAFREEFARYTNRLSFTWLNDLSFDQMLERVSNLPPRSFVFLILLLRDATGVTHNADEALKRIHEVANAPVNSIFQHQMGLGIVGGRLYEAELEGIESARVAIRILHGKPASSFAPKIIGPEAPQYDWRELRRWNIDEHLLPPGRTIKFREPTVWARYRAWFIGGISLFAVQALFISVLLVNLIKRRRAEISLRESRERMNLAASAADLGIWEWDMRNDRISAIDPNVPGIGSLNGQHSSYDEFIEKVHPADRKEVVHALARSMNGEGDYESVHRMVGAEGNIRWIAERGRVEFDAKRKALRMRGVSLDITARKAAEDKAKESEREFVLIANTAPVLIWASGQDKLCTFFNQPWLEFTGRAFEQELGNGWADGIHPDERAACVQLYHEAFDALRSFTIEYRMRRYDGQYRWLSDHGVPRYSARKEFLGYIGSCVDITERKEAEAEAQRTRQELAHVTRVSTVGELAGSIAHELNQPLTAILSNAQAAQRFLDGERSDVDQVREILGDIVEQDRRAGEVILRMRALLKKEQTRMQPQDLNQIIGEVLGLMRNELMTRKVIVATRLAPSLPQVRGDRVQLQQVLLNLVVNACDAMSAKPEPERRLTIETGRGENGYVTAGVIDCGPGFAPETLKRDFEAFRTTKPNGLGLGLPICQSIIKAHGGRLWAANNNTGGATVWFTLTKQEETHEHSVAQSVSGR